MEEIEEMGELGKPGKPVKQVKPEVTFHYHVYKMNFCTFGLFRNATGIECSSSYGMSWRFNKP